MPRPCSICSHADREAIDQALVAGEVFRNIAERFGTSTTALHRHKQEHIPAYLSQASEAQEMTQADSLLTKVQQINTYMAVAGTRQKATRIEGYHND